MQKRYIVRLSEEERLELKEVVKKLKGSPQKIKRAQILLKADVVGPSWSDEKISKAFDCRRQTVEDVRERLVKEGFEIALNGKKPAHPPRAKLLSGEQEAQLIALRLGSPPAGYGSWTLMLLKNEMVRLEIVETISHETIRGVLKKMVLLAKNSSTG